MAEVIAIVGGQWGDEGKGKAMDLLSPKATMAIRAQGGDNAGHTSENPQGKFALHLTPAGVFNPNCINIIGPGVALNLDTLTTETNELESKGVSTAELWISEKTHLVFPYHLYLDGAQEESRVEPIGTTKRGIGPAYMDKAQRIGLRAELLKDPDELMKQLKIVLDLKKQQLGNDAAKEDCLQPEYYEDRIRRYRERFADRVIDTDRLIHDQLEREDGFVVIEGAHGTLLDLDHGTYPYVTASSPTAAGLVLGAGIPPRALTRVLGIFKVYQSKVGEGPMPTELKDEVGDKLREKGHEYGTTTGRPRRTGWFDSVGAAYSDRVNGYTDIMFTKLDTLSGMGEFRNCRRYFDRATGQLLTDFPSRRKILERCVAAYEDKDIYEAVAEDISEVRDYEDLPEVYKEYVGDLRQNFKHARLFGIGVGPGRDEIIRTSNL